MLGVGRPSLLVASLNHEGSWPQAGAEVLQDSVGLLSPRDFKLGDRMHFPYCLSHFDLDSLLPEPPMFSLKKVI